MALTALTFSGALSGNATTASTWATARTLTIGNTGKAVNGSANVSWSLAEIGALPLTGGTLTGGLTIAYAGNNGFEIGRTDGVASTPFIDFHSGATATDYDVRLIASGGNGTSGNGSLNIVAATTTFSGSLIPSGKYVVQNAVDGTAARGINLWTTGDNNWGIYMSTSGAAKSLAGGTACTGITGRTGHFARYRVFNGSQAAHVWENSGEQCLMELTGDAGHLYVRGNIYAGNSTANLVPHAQANNYFWKRNFFVSETQTSDVWSGGIEIREVGAVGNTQPSNNYAPAITFHWSNVAASAIKMFSDASIRITAQGSTGSPVLYRDLYAAGFRGVNTSWIDVAGNQLLLHNGSASNSPTVIHRMDGVNYYLLLSNASTSVDGGWNGLRPLRIDAYSGAIASENSQYFYGGTNIYDTTSIVAPSEATASVTTVDTPLLRFVSKWWDGTSSTDQVMGMYGRCLTANGNPHIVWVYNGTDIAMMSPNGSIRIGDGGVPAFQLQLTTNSAGKPASNLWTVTSDARLKEEIEPADLDICYQNIKNLPLKRYKWRDDVYTVEQVPDRRKLGWIAQEVAAIMPKAVEVHPFTFNEQKDEDGEVISADVIEDCLHLDADQIMASLYGAVQKVMAMLEGALERIGVLEAALES
jgi:Chaperone of endosialidase